MVAVANPKEWEKMVIIERGINTKRAQNGVDLTLYKVYKHTSPAYLYEDKMRIIHTDKEEIKPGEDGMIYLEPGVYEIWFNEKVNIPSGLSGMIIQRSTFSRNGVFIRSAWYDSGFIGRAEALMIVGNPVYIEQGMRVAQLILFRSDEAELYRGSYLNQDI